MAISRDGSDHPAQLAAQIRALADRLAALEMAVGENAAPGSGGRPAASGTLGGPVAPSAPVDPPEGATLRYSGVGQFGPIHVQIFQRADLGTVLNADPGLITRVFAALAHPVRFAVLRALLGGPATSQHLRDVLDAGSVGQLYHHLKELLSAGLVFQPSRNIYAIPPGKVVAVCVAVMAATHLTWAGPPAGPPADHEGP
jgi:ArsR family transcriptional regulator, arsenate/arsenite/antimonite-responsive transcriptional repressor